MSDVQYLPTTEPYPFGTKLTIKSGGHHELLEAVVFQNDPPKVNGGGYRYYCLFPVPGRRPITAKVYSDEIESVTGIDINGDILCSGCAEETQARCFAQGITPATCA